MTDFFINIFRNISTVTAAVAATFLIADKISRKNIRRCFLFDTYLYNSLCHSLSNVRSLFRYFLSSVLYFIKFSSSSFEITRSAREVKERRVIFFRKIVSFETIRRRYRWHGTEQRHGTIDEIFEGCFRKLRVYALQAYSRLDVSEIADRWTNIFSRRSENKIKLANKNGGHRLRFNNNYDI